MLLLKKPKSLAMLFSVLVMSLSSSASAALLYIGKDRPAALKLPADYDTKQSYPLLLLLHGFGSDATQTVYYLEADRPLASRSYIILAPNGTINDAGKRYWNAGALQNPSGVDDSKYIQELIAEARSRFSIDAKRIYAMGVSNGGFMVYKLACDTEGLFAGIVSIAGGMFADTALCRSKAALSVLEVHGTRDTIVPFAPEKDNGLLGALESAKFWAERNGCKSFRETPTARDLMLQPVIPGLVLGDGSYSVPSMPVITSDQGERETDELQWSACSQGAKVGLWRVKGGSHVPDYSGKDLLGQALEFLP